jgi:hypothetical protein
LEGGGHIQEGKPLIMIAALNDFELLVFVFSGNAIDEAVFLRDAAGPESLKTVLEGFRLPERLKWIALNVFDAGVDPAENFFIGL